MNYHFEDFTEDNYRQLLRYVLTKWRPLKYVEVLPTHGCLWRHDIDISVQRAYRLAQIETEEGYSSTFFVYLHSNFYNALEKTNIDLLKKILNLGHDIGLHFDPEFYSLSADTDGERIDALLSFEKDILESVLRCDVRAFSFHNPAVGGWHQENGDLLKGGMVNTYAKAIRDAFSYCSDSNGYWRHERLIDFLMKDQPRIQVLTHPEWWTEQAMSPGQRVARAIHGRAEDTQRRYEQLLSEFSRVNVGGFDRVSKR